MCRRARRRRVLRSAPRCRPEIRTRSERARERDTRVLRPVAPVHENERDPVERGGRAALVRNLHEAARVGSNLVVVDLVDHERRRRRRRRSAAGDAAKLDQVRRRHDDVDRPGGGVEASTARPVERADGGGSCGPYRRDPALRLDPGGPAAPAGPAAPIGPAVRSPGRARVTLRPRRPHGALRARRPSTLRPGGPRSFHVTTRSFLRQSDASRPHAGTPCPASGTRRSPRRPARSLPRTSWRSRRRSRSRRR